MTNGRTLKSVWVLAAAAALAMAVGACSDPTTTKYDPEAHWTPSLTNPDIAVTNVTANSASVDFKTVALGKKATLDIVVENKGAAQMVIPSLATALRAPRSPRTSRPKATSFSRLARRPSS